MRTRLNRFFLLVNKEQRMPVNWILDINTQNKVALGSYISWVRDRRGNVERTNATPGYKQNQWEIKSK